MRPLSRSLVSSFQLEIMETFSNGNCSFSCVIGDTYASLIDLKANNYLGWESRYDNVVLKLLRTWIRSVLLARMPLSSDWYYGTVSLKQSVHILKIFVFILENS